MVAPGRRPRVPERGLSYIAGRAAAAVEHDCNVERRLSMTEFAARRIAAKAWTASGEPSRANVQRQRALEPYLRRALRLQCAGGAEPESSAEFTDEASAATIAAATQPSLRSSSLPHLQVISTRRFCSSATPGLVADRQLRLALGENLEAVRWNAASEKTFQHRRRAAATDQD